MAANRSPRWKRYGFGFLTGTTWDPNTEEYGILPEIWGTLYSSLLALLIGTMFGVAVAIFLTEGYLGNCLTKFSKLFGVQSSSRFRSRLPRCSENLLKNLVELLAAIPSVVYGLWGIFVIIPLIRDSCNWLHEQHGLVPVVRHAAEWTGNVPRLPRAGDHDSADDRRDQSRCVGRRYRRNFARRRTGLGATRWETLLAVILPTAAGGIFGAVVLAFGRAWVKPWRWRCWSATRTGSVFRCFRPPTRSRPCWRTTLRRRVAMKTRWRVLMYAGLVLMAITLIVNMIGAVILQRATAGLKGLG